jgi:hypothetical protein
VCRGDGSLDPILHVSKHVVVPEVGCPVIICGLQIATYLNGELGEVISYQNNTTGFRLEVVFQNKDFLSKMVKVENVQIATDLPGEGEVEYGEGWEESGNWWGESGKGEKAYEEVNVVERGRRGYMGLLSLRADCDQYMVDHIYYILFFVNNIFDCKKGIEAERTALRMTSIYCCIHGSEHNNAKRAKALLEKCKKRYVNVVLNEEWATFQVDLQLYDNIETLVIIGPITKPRNIANERTVQLRQDQVPIPCKGCPVFFHGLVSQSYLNGELGDVATYRDVEGEFQIQVMFEKQQLKFVWVCRENLKIAFELPRRAMTRLNPNDLPWIGEDNISLQRNLIETGLCSDLP